MAVKKFAMNTWSGTHNPTHDQEKQENPMHTLQLRIEQAFEAGEKTGIARKQKDEARAKFHSDWFHRFYAMQPQEDKTQLRQAFDNGYSAGRGSIPVTPFR